tara:strand:+ start:1768 stop:3585 length:1818 start_codon:yes stop_codon:yes gene_type:complete
MATLAEVNKTLIEVSDNTEKTSEGISAFVSYIDEQRRKTLEAEREAKAEKAKLEAASSKASAGGGGKSAKAGGFFDGAGGLLGAGSLLGLGALTGRALLRRLPGLGLIGFADTIADALLGDDFPKDFKETVSRGIQGAGIGMLLGRRFIPIFTVLGLLATDENKKILKDTGENLKKQYEKAMENLKPFLEMLPSLDDITKFLSTQATAGLKGIRGFTESGFNSKEFQENWESSVGLLGSVAFLLMPGKFLKALRFLAKFALSKKGLVTLITGAAAGKIGMDLFGENGTFGGDTALAAGGLAAGGAYLGFKAIQGAGTRGAPTASDDAARAKQSKLNRPGSINQKTNKIVGVDGKDTAVSGDSKDAKKLQKNIKNLSGKYPRIFSGKGVLKFLKGFGPLAALSGVFAMSEVQDVLASQLPEDEKKKQIGNILGMELNALTLGGIGAAIGGLGFGPKGAILGGTVASVLGAFAPNVAGGFLADFFLGGNPRLSPEQQKAFSTGAYNRMMEGMTSKGGVQTFGDKAYMTDVSSTVGISAPVRPPNNFSDKLQSYMGTGLTASGVDYGGSIALGNNSNNTNNTFNSTVGQTYIGSGPTVDLKDQFGFGT